MRKLYEPTHTELLVSAVLTDRGIKSKEQLNIKDLAQAFDIFIHYGNINAYLTDGDTALIFLDGRKEKKEQYLSFLHELAHHLREDLSTARMARCQHTYTELKARCLMGYIGMPFFLINTILGFKTIREAADYFGLPYRLAEKRVTQIYNRMFFRGGLYAGIQRQENRALVL